MFPSLNLFRKYNEPVEDPRKKMFEGIFPVDTPQDPFSGMSQPIKMEEPQQPGFMDVYKELMSRQNGPAMSAYRKFVEQGAPTKETIKPDKLTRLGAILSGAAAGFQNPSEGVRVTRDILDRPFEDALHNYKSQGGRLQELASLEEGDTKNKIASVKAVGELQNQQVDNKRQDALAQSLMNQRALTMKETQQRIEANGATFHEDQTTGIGYLVKRDGTRIPVGKFDMSTGEKLESDLTKMREQDKLVGTRQVKLDNINFGNQKTLQDDRQSHSINMQNQGQENAKELIDLRATRAAENAAKRVKVTNPSIYAQIKTNVTKVDSLVDADPDKYEDLWDGENLGDKPAEGDPKLAAYKELYDALYNGVAVLSTTKGGNRIER